MATQLSPNPKFTEFDLNGDPLVGGKLYTYEAGTSTLKATYTDSSGTNPNTNPVILDANGQANVWIDTGLYKFILKDADDNEIWSVDDIERAGTGPKGASFVTGSGAPSNLLGEDGDTYLDTVSLLFYEKSGGVWALNGGSITALSSLTGDVVASGPGAGTAVIQNDTVTNAKLANVPTQTFKGRTTASTGDPEDLTATQATAMLNVMVGDSGSGGTKGLVPAAGAGDAASGKVLGAGGTWVDGGSGQGGINWITNPSAKTNTTGWQTFNENMTFNSVNLSRDEILINETGFEIRQGVRILYTNSGGTPIGGLTSGTVYYGCNVFGTSAFGLSLTPNGAWIDLTSNGSGTHTFTFQEVNSGIGGTSNITIARNTTNPLLPSSSPASFTFTKGAADRKREGWSTDFTIDPAYLAKVITLQFQNLISSGTFAAGSSNLSPGDVVVWLLDKTNNVLIQPSTIFIGSNSSTIPFQYDSTFQSASNSRDYRLIFYINSTSTSAYTFKSAGFTATPSEYVTGTPVTGLTRIQGITVGAVTTPPTKATAPVSDYYEWRQVGQFAEIHYKYYTTVATGSAAGSGVYLFSLPPGMSMDTSIQANTAGSTADANLLISAHMPGSIVKIRSNSGPTGAFDLRVVAYSASQFFINYQLYGSTGSGTMGSSAFPFTDVIAFDFFIRVPIAGWSSSVQMSDSASQSIIVANVNGINSVSTASGSPINFNGTIISDTVNGITQGAAWKYTAQVAGQYRVSVGWLNSAAGTQPGWVYKNGVAFQYIAAFSSGYNSGDCIVPMVAGDYIDIRPNGGAITPSNIGYINIERISGPQTIAATETIAASYWLNANQALTADVTNIIFNSQEYDYTGIWNSSTGVGTVSNPGLYEFTVLGANTVNSDHDTYLWKSTGGGSLAKYKLINRRISNWPIPITTQVRFNAGDTFAFRINVGNTWIGSATLVGALSYFSVRRVGN